MVQSESKNVAAGLLFELRDELDRWLGAVRGGNGTWVPATDMYEADGELYVEIEIPGVESSDVEILTEGRELTIRALSSDPRSPKEADLLERRRGTYERTLPMPGGWDATRARAEFQHGILTLRIPQSVEPERARRITLGGGATNSRPAPAPTQPSFIDKDKAQGSSNGAPTPNGNGAAKPAEMPALAGAVMVGGALNESKP